MTPAEAEGYIRIYWLVPRTLITRADVELFQQARAVLREHAKQPRPPAGRTFSYRPESKQQPQRRKRA